MNAKQRRAERRRIGARPPFFCYWCKSELPTFDAACTCSWKYNRVTGAALLQFHKRHLLEKSKIDYLYYKAWNLGLDLEFSIREPSPIEKMVKAARSEDEVKREEQRALCTVA